MDRKFFFLILFVIISIFVCINVNFAAGVQHTIPVVDMDLYPKEDGTLHVKETIHFSNIGFPGGIYWIILPVNDTQAIENITVSSKDIDMEYEVDDRRYGREVMIFFNNRPNTSYPNVDVFIEYDIIKAIKVYNDLAELNYIIGKQWDITMDQVNIIVHLKSREGIDYQIKEQSSGKISWQDYGTWDGNTLKITGRNIQEDDYSELKITIPREQFADNPVNAEIINQNYSSLNETTLNETTEKSHHTVIHIPDYVYYTLILFILLLSLVPLIIYLLYGREPKIDYLAEYEYDLPTEDPPAIVNAVVHHTSKKVGEPDMDGFKATFLDLINRKYLHLYSQDENIDWYGFKGMFVEINHDKDTSSLFSFEIDVLDFIKSYELEGIVSMEYMRSDLFYNYEGKARYMAIFNQWKTNVKKEIFGEGDLSKLFDMRGHDYSMKFGILALMIAGVTAYIILNFALEPPGIVLLSCGILAVSALTCLFLHPKYMGKRTEYGMEYEAHWLNYKRYIKDYSLIDQREPEAISIWNNYLVYATALGMAGATSKALNFFELK